MKTAEHTRTSPAAALLAELEQEAATTRRVLESVPESRYDWRPHPKGRPMGELCGHIAALPGAMPGVLDRESFDVSERPDSERACPSREEVLALHDEGIRTAREWLEGLGDGLHATWRLTRDAEELMALPRAAAIRTLLFNHLYHHRGQLSAYLRAAGEPVPSIYGPSADENPFM